MASDTSQQTVVDTIVVGGGIAGLGAARAIARQGRSVMLIEASDRLGGRLAAVDIAGMSVDAGAESFATRGGTVQALCAELGLADDVVQPLPRRAWVVAPGAAYPLPTTSWLGIPASPLSPEVRSVLGVRAAWRAACDLVIPPRVPAPDASLGSVVRSRLGGVAAEKLVAPVVTGVYTHDIDDIALDAIAPGLAGDVARRGLIRTARARRAASPPGSAVRSLAGGMYRLIEALEADARAHGARLLTGAEVTGVERRPAGWSVATNRETFDATHVVMAVPADVAATLVGLVPPARRAGKVAMVIMVIDAPTLDAAPRGTGVLARPGVARAKALTHASAKWHWLADRLPEGRHVVRLSYDIEDPVDDVASFAVSDAAALLGVTLSPDAVVAMSTHVWPDAAPSAPMSAVPEGIHLVGAAAGLTGLAAITAHLASTDFS